MSTPQPGILPEPPANAYFIVLRAADRARDAVALLRDAARAPAMAAEVTALDPKHPATCNVGIGAELWDAAKQRRPKGLRPFPTIENPHFRVPATGGDLFLHILCDRRDLAFELARRLVRALGARVEVAEDVQGFRYLDSRDLTGFIDGTENPKNDERAAAALIGEEDRDFAGGSYVITQRYVHDLKSWESLPRPTQESVIGRTKPDSVEIEEKAPTSHVGRVVIEEGGEELQILRHSFPYGDLREAGLFFVAYTRDLAIPEKMMRRMFGASGDGMHDHLMDFTRPVTGAVFFLPPAAMLQKLAGT
jgi:putative iron-dependent peroxidase